MKQITYLLKITSLMSALFVAHQAAAKNSSIIEYANTAFNEIQQYAKESFLLLPLKDNRAKLGNKAYELKKDLYTYLFTPHFHSGDDGQEYPAELLTAIRAQHKELCIDPTTTGCPIRQRLHSMIMNHEYPTISYCPQHKHYMLNGNVPLFLEVTPEQPDNSDWAGLNCPRFIVHKNTLKLYYIIKIKDYLSQTCRMTTTTRHELEHALQRSMLRKKIFKKIMYTTLTTLRGSAYTYYLSHLLLNYIHKKQRPSAKGWAICSALFVGSHFLGKWHANKLAYYLDEHNVEKQAVEHPANTEAILNEYIYSAIHSKPKSEYQALCARGHATPKTRAKWAQKALAKKRYKPLLERIKQYFMQASVNA